jgi:hypothetical protein
MNNFKQIELSDKAWMDPLLRLSNYRGAEYCFANLFVWRSVYRTHIMRWNDFLLIRTGSLAHPTDFFPAGCGELKLMMEFLLTNALEEKRDFRMAGVSVEHVALFQQFYPKLFSVAPVRDSWDYIYHASDLCTLPGKRYQSKRNHIARFVELPDWRYEPVNKDNIPECIQMNQIWCQQVGCMYDKSLFVESCAAEIALNHFEVLGLEGALLRVSGRVVAYTVGEPISSDTYIVHIEKAFPDVRGAYPTINREFIRDKGASFTFVNREDDAGDEGLRRAKSSYHPVFMQEKYLLTAPFHSLSQWRCTT